MRLCPLAGRREGWTRQRIARTIGLVHWPQQQLPRQRPLWRGQVAGWAQLATCHHSSARTSRARACTAHRGGRAPAVRGRAERGAARARRGARGVQRRAERRAQLGRAAAGLQIGELPLQRLHAARAQPQRQRRVQRQACQRERQQQAGRAGAAAARRAAAGGGPPPPGGGARGPATTAAGVAAPRHRTPAAARGCRCP